LIYSSGTTGLPKAVNVTHERILEWSFWFAGMMDLRPDDRLYNCLPMYHSVGGIIAIGAPLVRGASVVIRQRLSVTDFWHDVAATDCSIIQYVGEMCRYLSRTPPSPKETQHRVRLACGNGLHADVWQSFQQRFHVPKILEFYAATEGVISLYNCEGKPGAIGRIPSFLAHRFAIRLIRNDSETGEPLRDSAGFCIACSANEVGEAIRQIAADDIVASRFDGYTDVEASTRKVLSNVFSKGDRWYRAGDLMRRDTAGYFYFVDRIGDTFRWRGENVATTEVASVLRRCPGIADAVVYGVAVPGQEGRAGMATVVTDGYFDIEVLWAHLARNLPKYARPLFLRLCDTLDATGTFKLTQRKLADEGYKNIADPVWFNDHAGGCFIICDDALVQAIDGGARRL
jgi:fatty-acyl-CoA synthase